MELNKLTIFRNCSSNNMTKFLNFLLSRACVFTLLLTLVQHADITEANHDRVCDYRSRAHDRGLCGSGLANTLWSLCRSLDDHGFTKYIVKRQTEKTLDDNLRSIMLNKKDALSYLAKREATGTIICECCYHQCTVFELIQYCDLPSHVVNSMRNSDISQAALAN